MNSARWVVLAYWVASLWTGTLVFGLVIKPALHLAPRWRIPPLAALPAGALLAAIPLSLRCRLVAGALWPVGVRHVAATVWYMQVLLISAPRTLAYAVSSGFRLRAEPIEPSSGDAGSTLRGRIASPDAAAFLDRLPARIRREIVALQMEDHYVRVHTMKRSALVLAPLHQVIAELYDMAGVKVHRSWWVVSSAVTGSVKDGRNLRLRLSNGLEAPVSHTCLSEAKAAGLLSR